MKTSLSPAPVLLRRVRESLHRAPRPKQRRELQLETLEERTLLDAAPIAPPKDAPPTPQDIPAQTQNEPAAAPVSWVGTDGAWENGANWSTGNVPTTADDVTIDPTGGPFTITINSAVSVKSLNCAENLTVANGSLTVAEASSISGNFTIGGNITANGALTLSGTTTWNGGNLGGTATITNTGTLTKSSANLSLLTDLSSTGTVNLSAGQLFIDTGKALTNQSAGILNLSGTMSTGGSGALANAGTLNVSGGTPTTGQLANTGTVNVDGGTLILFNGGSSSGVFDVDAGATVQWQNGTGSGTFLLNPGAQLNGSGLYTLVGFGSVTLNGATVNVAPRNLHFDPFVVMPGTGKLTIASGATFEFFGGSFAATGGLDIASGGTVNLMDVSFGQSISGTTLTNHGAMNFIGATSFSVFQGGTVVNAADGVMNFNAAVTIGGPAGSTVNNLGTMSTNAPGATVTLNLATDHTGTIHALAGTFSINAALTTSGAFNVDAGATIGFNANFLNLTMSPGTTWSGAGLISVGANTTVTIPTGVNLSTPQLRVNGLLAVNGTYTVPAGGNLDVPNIVNNGSQIGGSGTVTIPSTGTLTGQSLLLHDTITITNNGTATLRRISTTGADTKTFNNNAGATFTVTHNASVTAGIGARLVVNNEGTLNFTAAAEGAGGSFIDAVFNNTGALNVLGGFLRLTTLNLGGTSVSTGAFNAGAGTKLEFNARHNFNAGAAWTGAGSFVFNAGNYTLGSGLVYSAANTSFVGATFLGPGSVAVPAGATWSAEGFATFQNLAAFTLAAGSSFANVGGVTFDNTPVTNSGLLSITGTGGAALILRNGTAFNNAASGEMRFLPTGLGGGVISTSGSGNSFTNNGLLTRDGGTGDFNFFASGNLAFTNPGTIETRSGTFTIFGQLPQVSLDGTQLTGGTWHVLGGAALTINSIRTQDFFGNPLVTIVENQADVTLSGAGSRFNALDNLATNSGTLTLLDGATLDINLFLQDPGPTDPGGPIPGPLTNTGTLELGDDARVNVGTDYTQDAAGTLRLIVGDTVAGGGGGRLVVAETATFAGTLGVQLDGGFFPTAGDDYVIATYANRVGNFATFENIQPLFDPAAGATSYVLEATGVAADLAASNVTAPANGTAGSTIAVSYTVTNNATDPTGASQWTDSIYLSPTAVFNAATALLLARVPHTGALGPGASYPGSANVTLPAAVPGNYFVIVVTDSRSQVADNFRANNAAASNVIAVSVPTLTLGTPINGTIAAGQSLIFKATLLDAVVRLQVTTAVAGGAELIVRADGTPQFDGLDTFAFDPANTTQTVVTDDAGETYILLRGTALAGAGTAFTLLGAAPPFSLDETSPTAATNNGEVTLTLRGAQFTTATAVSLVPATGPALTPTRTIVQDATTIFVTFDLNGVAPGDYDVSIADGALTDVLADAFTVLDAPAVALPEGVSLTMTVPARVRVGRVGTMLVTVTNASGHDVPAPFLILSSDNANFRLPGTHHFVHEFVEFFATNPNGDPKVLPPGFKAAYLIGFIPIEQGDGIRSNFTIQTLQQDAALDLGKLDNEIRIFDNFTDTEWATLRTQLVAQLGPTYGDYERVLRGNIGLLTEERSLEGPPSPIDLLHVELDRARAALNPSAAGQLTSSDPDVELGGRIVFADNQTTGEATATRAYADGSFIFPELTPGDYTFRIDGLRSSAPGGVVTIGATTHASGISIVGEEGASIAGLVRGAGNVPLADAVVVAVRSDGARFATTSGEDGSYALAGLPADDYTLTAEAEGRARGFSGLITVNGTQSVAQDFTLGTEAQILGRVIGPAVDTIRVTASLVGTTDQEHRYAATVDADGRFKVGHLPLGTYDLTIAAEGYVTQTTPVFVNVGGGIDLGNLPLVGAGTISGTVSAPAGVSLVGLGITLEQAGLTVGGAVLGVDGVFSIPEVAPGTYTVRVQNASGVVSPVVVTVGPGETVSDVALAIQPGGRIGGVLRSAGDNMPLAGRMIVATAADGTQVGALTAADGSYTLTGLAAGSYSVFAVGFSGAQSVAVADLSGTTTVTANLTVAFTHTTVLRGQLRDAGGTIIPQGAVDLVENGEVIATSTVNAQGEFEFRLNRGGTFDLVAVSARASFAPVTVVLTPGLQLINDLTAGAFTLTANVTGVADATGAFVVAYRIEGGRAVLAGSGSAAANGTATIPNLRPGDYTVRVFFGDQGGTAPVTLAANGSVNIALQNAFALSGTLSGPGAAGAALTLIPAADPAGVLRINADATGGYIFNQVLPGTYTLVVAGEGAQTATFPGLVVNAATDFDATLVAGTRAITGTVVEGPDLPLHSGTVSALDANGVVLGQTAIRPDGTFALIGLPAGAFTLRIASSGHTPLVQTNVTVNAGQTLALGTVTLPGVAVAGLAGAGTAPSPLLPASALSGSPVAPLASSGAAQAFAEFLKNLANQILGLEKGPQPPEPDPDCPECAGEYAAAKAAAEARDNFLENTLKPAGSDLLENGTKLGIAFALEAAVFAGKISAATLALSAAFPAIGSATGLAALEAAAAAGGAGSAAAIDLAIVQAVPLIQSFIGSIQAEAENIQAALAAADIKSGVTSLGKLGKALYDQYSSLNKLADLGGASGSALLGRLGAIGGLLGAFLDPFKNTANLATPAGTSYDNFKRALDLYHEKERKYEEALEKYYECLARNSADPDCDPDDDDGGGRGGPGGGGAGGGTGQGSSLDPNDIIGPEGVGTPRYVAASQVMPYTIRFENLATATAPAAEVKITQTLDGDLDFSTFELAAFGFGGEEFAIPAGLSTYQTRFDLRDTRGIFLDVKAELDLTSGVLTWTFTSIDPLTGDVPGDADLGFLPPNVTGPEGEGFVSYTVQPKAAVATGAVIDAQASIVFDANAAIVTPAIFNTIDADAPAAVLAALPAQSGPDFTLSWTGSDAASGIAGYDLFVSDNGGDYTPLVLGTNRTAFVFTGEAGHSYAFVLRATDRVGNRSPVPAAPDTSVNVVPAVVLNFDAQNPLTFTDANGSLVTVKVKGRGAGTATLNFGADTGDLRTLDLTGLNAKASVTVKVKGGDGATTITRILADDALKALTLGPGVTLGDGLNEGVDDLYMPTPLKALKFGALADFAQLTLIGGTLPNGKPTAPSFTAGAIGANVVITNQSGFGDFTAASWVSGAFFAGQSVKSFTVVSGGLQANIDVDGLNNYPGVANLGPVKIGGAYSASFLTVEGSLASFQTGAVYFSTVRARSIGDVNIQVPTGLTHGVETSAFFSTKDIGTFTVGGKATQEQVNLLFLRAGGKIASVDISAKDKSLGVLRSAFIFAGQDVAITKNADLVKASLGSVTTSGGVFGSQIAALGNLGAVGVGGNVLDSDIAAGTNVGGDLALLTADDTFHRHGSIKSVAVAGALLRSSIVAGVRAGADFIFGGADDALADALAGMTAQAKIGAIKLGAATVAPGTTTPFAGPVTLDHTNAIQAPLLASLRLAGRPTFTDFTAPIWIDADGEGDEDAEEIVVRKF